MGNRKQPVNTITAEIQAFQDAKKKIEAPILLSSDSTDVFDEIITARPYSAWNAVEIRLAANTARQIAMIQDFHNEIASEGVLIGEPGKEKINPKIQASEMICKSVLATLRHLGVSAVQRGAGRGATTNLALLESASRAEYTINNGNEESLLA